jgi:hypothetical protein
MLYFDDDIVSGIENIIVRNGFHVYMQRGKTQRTCKR